MGLFDKFKRKSIKTPEQRRAASNKKIKDRGIACNENLPVLEDSSQVKLKDMDEICKRAIACLLSTQIAMDADTDDYEQSKEMFYKLLKEFGVQKDLLSKEKKVFFGHYSKQDVIDVVWTYEAYWSLVWALGLIDDIGFEYPKDICDCQKAISLVGDCKSYDEFKSKCKLRNTEEILDMLDLYYRYHWATTEKRIRPDTPIGELNKDVVVERRRGLEWLISDVKDWNYISLDT
ncbi:MAG: DUF4272 domain-containing protein [Eubacterium sp.]|nr:DUF4272 domain-containing protein [Eubacterium sp.]MDE6768015.1 DUF4272 domain-containing protein [Eubacterium sp.]